MPGPTSICAIIPTYNRASMLRECIDSLLAQSRTVDEILVVNDGSTDDTEKTVRSYGNRLTLINKENGGKSSALNLALAQCAADYIWICDDDDIAAPDAARQLAEVLDADDSLGLSLGAYRTFRDIGTKRIFSDPVLYSLKDEPDIHINFLEIMFTYQFAALVRRKTYRDIGPFRTDMDRVTDYDMFIRLSRHAKAAYVPHAVFHQRQHEGVRGSSSEVIYPEQMIRKQLACDQKLFAEIRQHYDLSAYAPTFALNWDTVRARRAALLQRACIFAKRELWEDALDDLDNAYKLSPSAFSPEEARLLKRVDKRASPWEWRALFKDAGWLANIRSCHRLNEFGRLMVHNACRPLVGHARYSLRTGNFSDVALMSRILASILGVRGFSSRIVSSILS